MKIGQELPDLDKIKQSTARALTNTLVYTFQVAES